MLCVETSSQWWVPVTYIHHDHVVSISWYWNAVIITVVSLVFAFLGFLSPNCEAIPTTVLVLYVFLGIGGWIYFRLPLQKNSITMEEQCANDSFPLSRNFLFDLDLALWLYHSAAAILFTTLLAWLLSFWHFDVDLDFSVISIWIFRNQIPLDFINHIKNTPATFQRMINTVISGLQGCNAYINDVIMYSDTWDLHVKQLKVFLCRLQDAHLIVNLVKSEFC